MTLALQVVALIRFSSGHGHMMFPFLVILT